MSQQAQSRISFNQFCSWLYTPVDCSTLVLFRLLYAGLILLYAVPFWLKPTDYIAEVDFIPTYSFMRFAENWPAMDLTFALTCLCLGAFGLLLGLCYRLSAIVFFLSYTSVYVLIPIIYNNHYYLIALLAFWWIFINGNAQLSLDSLWRADLPKNKIPRWHLLVIQTHISMVYFFGGIAKFNSDWLQGEPMGYWLSVQGDFPLLGPLLLHPQAGLVMAWLGLIFDLMIPFLLIYKPTRILGFCGTLIFHSMNSRIFDIGIFPFMMLGTNVLYLDPDSPRRWWHWLVGIKEQMVTTAKAATQQINITSRQKALVALLCGYFFLHCLMPFRHHFFRGNVEWNEQAKNFSWRMMLSAKEVDFFAVRVVDEDGRQWLVKIEDYLSQIQQRGTSVMGNPRHMACFARFIKQEAIRKKQMIDPKVYVLSICSLNGRPYQFLVDPHVDLATAEVPFFQTPDWVLPLKPNQKPGNYPQSVAQRDELVKPVFLGYLAEIKQP